MCKANESIITKVANLMELRKAIEALQDEAEAITDEIKEYMGSEETMMAGSWKKILGDALDDYYKTVITRPFKVI